MIRLFKRFWNWLCITRKGTIGAILCGIVLFLYVVKCLEIAKEGNTVDPSITYCVFGAVCVWLITSALIRCNSDKLDNKTLLQRIQNFKFNIGENSFDVTLTDDQKEQTSDSVIDEDSEFVEDDDVESEELDED